MDKLYDDHGSESQTQPKTDVASAPFPIEKYNNYLLRFLNRLKQTGKSAHTISAYRNDLSTFGEFLASKSIDPSVFYPNIVEEWIAYLHEQGRKSAASVRRAQMSVRTYMHFLISESVITGSPFLEIKSPRQPKHDLLSITAEHYEKLVSSLKEKANDNDEKAMRDLALVYLLGECGLKASEAAALTWGDIFLESSPDDMPEYVEGMRGGSVRIPGPNERVLKFNSDVQKALVMLRQARQHLNLSVEPSAKLFFGYKNVSRQTRTDALHRHGIKFIIYEICDELFGIPYNSESLRNSAILRWLNQGLNVNTVAELAGYSSLHSLERFSHTQRGFRKPRRMTKAKHPNAGEAAANQPSVSSEPS